MATIGPYDLGTALGSGATAQVRLGTHRVTGDVVAIKMISKARVGLTMARSLANVLERDGPGSSSSDTTSQGHEHLPLAVEREVGILKLLDHPHLLQLVDVWENKDYVFLVTEYANQGDLLHFLCADDARGRGLHEEEAVRLFRQLMSAMDYVHAHHIVHRDLKLENLLIHNGQIKVCDFGMATILQTPTAMLRTSCGSIRYCAPEILKDHHYRGELADIWSMGIILYAMLTGNLPFPGDEDDRLTSKVIRGIYNMPAWLSEDAKDMIRRTLNVEPGWRITMDELWHHPLVTKYGNFDQLNLRTMMPWNVAEGQPIPADEIDIDILRQMSTMWYTFSEAALIKILGQKERSQQQLVYQFMLQHKEKHQEQYQNNALVPKTDIHHFKPLVNAPTGLHAGGYYQFGGDGGDKIRIRVVANCPDIDGEDEYDEWLVGLTDDFQDNVDLSALRDARAGEAKATVPNDDVRSLVAPAPSFVTQKTANSQRSRHRIFSPGSPSSSIRTCRSTPRQVHNPRKRNVNFSAVRHTAQRARYNGDESSILGSDLDDFGDFGDRASLASLPKLPVAARGGYQGPTLAAGAPREEIWSEELKEFHETLAGDIDRAFTPSLLIEDEKKRSTSRASSQFCLSIDVNAPILPTTRFLGPSRLDPGRSSSLSPTPEFSRPGPGSSTFGSKHLEVPKLNTSRPVSDSQDVDVLGLPPRSDPAPYVNRPLPPIPTRSAKADQAKGKQHASKPEANESASTAKPAVNYRLFPKIDNTRQTDANPLNRILREENVVLSNSGRRVKSEVPALSSIKEQKTTANKRCSSLNPFSGHGATGASAKTENNKRYSSLGSAVTPQKTTENEGLMSFGQKQTIRMVPASPVDDPVPRPLTVRKSIASRPTTPTPRITVTDESLVPKPLNLDLVNEKRMMSIARKTGAEAMMKAKSSLETLMAPKPSMEKRKSSMEKEMGSKPSIDTFAAPKSSMEITPAPKQSTDMSTAAKSSLETLTVRRSRPQTSTAITKPGIETAAVNDMSMPSMAQMMMPKSSLEGKVSPKPAAVAKKKKMTPRERFEAIFRARPDSRAPPKSKKGKRSKNGGKLGNMFKPKVTEEEQAKQQSEKKGFRKFSLFKGKKEDKGKAKEVVIQEPNEEIQREATEAAPKKNEDHKDKQKMRMSIIQPTDTPVSYTSGTFLESATSTASIAGPSRAARPAQQQSPTKSAGKATKKTKKQKPKRKTRRRLRWWHMRKPEIIHSDFEEWEDRPMHPIELEPELKEGEQRQHWFFRLFRVKPVRRYICFTMRGKHALLEIKRLLRRWEDYGIEDLVVDEKANVIRGRVSGDNPFGAKELAFRIEVNEVIIETTRQHLSIARVDQVAGAASSLNRLVDNMGREFRERLMLVDDETVEAMMLVTYRTWLASVGKA
ncbi:hypothetical protein OQA88_6637 [Cercophora sp. LCS_1]